MKGMHALVLVVVHGLILDPKYVTASRIWINAALCSRPCEVLRLSLKSPEICQNPERRLFGQQRNVVTPVNGKAEFGQCLSSPISDIRFNRPRLQECLQTKSRVLYVGLNC
jgi:hypothetical protein